MKPRLRYYCGVWRCSGAPYTVQAAGQTALCYPFPWGHGPTPIAAYNAYGKLLKQKRKPLQPVTDAPTLSTPSTPDGANHG